MRSKLGPYLVLIIFLLLNYIAAIGWWISSLATLGILLFAYRIWPNDFRNRLGVPTRLVQVIISLSLLIIFLFLAYELMTYIRTQQGLGFSIGFPQNYFHIAFYTLNEEFIVGALLLFSLKKRFAHIHPMHLSWIAALIFAILHIVFYKWIFLPPARGNLTVLTIISLTLVGMIRNNFILSTDHIGYAWTLHFSWMAIMFGCGFYNPETNIYLTEAERFNLFIGNPITLFVGSILAASTGIWLIGKSKTALSEK